MPELPEVETVRDGLERHIVHTTIAEARVYRDYSVRRHLGGPADFEDQLQGLEISYVARRGKFLWIGFSEVDEVLVGHLGMSGQLLIKERLQDLETGELVDPELGKHCRVRLHLASDGRTEPNLVLDFVDQRTFGYLALSAVQPTPDLLPGGLGTAHPLVPELLGHIARDLLDPVLVQGSNERAVLNKRIRTKNGAIKKVLLDQEIVSGVGNIYADEALWRAQIHGERAANKLTRAQIDVLLESAHSVMTQALRQGGTSFDALYVNVNGESGQLNIALKRVEVSRRQVISQSDLVRQALTKRLDSPTCSVAHRRSPGSRSLRGASHA